MAKNVSDGMTFDEVNEALANPKFCWHSETLCINKMILIDSSRMQLASSFSPELVRTDVRYFLYFSDDALDRVEHKQVLTGL